MQPQRPLLSIPKWLVLSILLISFIGFIDATYLSVEHLTGAAINCTITNGCDEVTNSQYSFILGIPVALLGVVYYLTIFIGTILYLERKKIAVLRIISWLTIAGFIFSVWFTFAQAFLIKAYCQYCLLSALTSTILFILGMWLLTKTRSISNREHQNEVI